MAWGRSSPRRTEPQQTFGMELFERIVAEEGQDFLGWRRDQDRRRLAGRERPGRSSRSCGTPSSAASRALDDADRFERKLYVIRKRFEKRDRRLGARRSQVLLLLQPVVPHPGLQGNAHAPSSSASTSPTTWATRCLPARSACSTRGSAPTRSRAGSSPTPIA